MSKKAYIGLAAVKGAYLCGTMTNIMKILGKNLTRSIKKKFEAREKAAGKRAEKEEERGIRDFVMEMMKEKAEAIPAQTLLEKFREIRKLEKPDIDRSSTGMSEEDFEELLAQILYYQLEAEEEAFLTALAAKEAEEEALSE